MRVHEVLEDTDIKEIYLVMDFAMLGEIQSSSFWKEYSPLEKSKINEQALSEKDARIFFKQLIEGVLYCRYF